MRWSRPSSRWPGSTRRPGADADLGGFGALFDLKAAGFEDPILVAANDGVGTKLKIAIDTGQHATIGIDLVAMCVNDLLAQGAEPLFFLDYFATGKLDVATARSVIAGIAEGCRQAGCALIGGETAEMPGMYAAGDYDLAGFAVGAVERGALLPRPDIAAGDVLIGLPSSGVHSNGYSLVRRLVAEAKLGWDAPAPFAAGNARWPRRCWRRRASTCKPVLRRSARRARSRRLAHITGGGLSENLPRVLPGGSRRAHRPCAPGRRRPCSAGCAQAGNLDDAEMLRTFNCGIGMVVVAAQAERRCRCCPSLRAAGEAPVLIGDIEPGRGVKSAAKGKGEAEAVRYSGKLGYAG